MIEIQPARITAVASHISRLPQAKRKEFLLKFAGLLADWFDGQAVNKTFTIKSSATQRIVAKWSTRDFSNFATWVQFLAKASPSPSMTLYRGIVTKPKDAPESEGPIVITPRNALHSWSQSEAVADDFIANIRRGQAGAIFQARMPANRIGFTADSAKKICASVIVDARTLASGAGVDADDVIDAWEDVKDAIQEVAFEKEVVCMGTQPINADVLVVNTK